MPLEYYRRTLDGLPAGLRLAFFSDDPDFVAEHFGHLDPWLSKGASAGVDLHLMGACRYMVIANSSFSWWAAYLNKTADPVILAPKFHIGWREKAWYPRDIEVQGWTYVEI